MQSLVKLCAKVLYLGVGLKLVGKRFPLEAYWGRSTTVKRLVLHIY
jgi:hypothetical protein